VQAIHELGIEPVSAVLATVAYIVSAGFLLELKSPAAGADNRHEARIGRPLPAGLCSFSTGLAFV